MAYEIDFIGVPKKTKDADAIAMRWLNSDGSTYTIGVYDGGTAEYGEALCDLLNEYYFPGIEEKEDKVIDFVICSHSDLDHASGLKAVLENFNVKVLYMNRPWLYIDDVYKNVDDKRITPESLERKLKDSYKFVADLEELANSEEIPIKEAFQGENICGKLSVLSPSKDFYIDLLSESEKTPLISESKTESFFSTIKKAIRYIKDIWNTSNLKKDVSTSAENEMSVVVLGKVDEEFLLTGDAGVRALNAAADFVEKQGKSLRTVKIYQIPHHGGRHNLNPSVMERIVGKILQRGEKSEKIACVSVGFDSDHPRKVVVNDFIKRGVDVYETKGKSLWYNESTPSRAKYKNSTGFSYSTDIEDWDN